LVLGDGASGKVRLGERGMQGQRHVAPVESGGYREKKGAALWRPFYSAAR